MIRTIIVFIVIHKQPTDTTLYAIGWTDMVLIQ